MVGGYMYILLCADGSYYTGSTKDLESRIAQHQADEGANYTKKRLPIKLVYYEEYQRIDEAFDREKRVQGWSRNKKQALIDNRPDDLHLLAECKNENHYKNVASTSLSDHASTTCNDHASTSLSDHASTSCKDPASTSLSDPSSSSDCMASGDDASTSCNDHASTSCNDPTSTSLSDPLTEKQKPQVASTSLSDPSSSSDGLASVDDKKPLVVERSRNHQFKQTEIGLIPEDWNVSPLKNITNLMTNGFVGTAKTQYVDSSDGILYIQGYNVIENSFNFNGIKRVNKEFHLKNSKSNLKEGDLLTVQTGDVGLTTIVPKELEGSNCHALIITRFKKHKVYPKFVAFYLNSFIGRERLRAIETGTTMKHINVGDMIHFEVPIPPTVDEQKAIVQVLSDTDNLIQAIEQKLAKKRAVKQGAMQQLLTPKEDWIIKKAT